MDGDVEECSLWAGDQGVRVSQGCAARLVSRAFRQRSPASCNHPRPAPISVEMCLACPVLAVC